ncbi:MAG: transcription termination/antitermination protein NusG [Planctomycetota bacterium]
MDDQPHDTDGEGGGAVLGDKSTYPWYVLKVASNREKTAKAALERQIARDDLGDYFGEVLIPTRKIVEAKGGKKKVIEEKLFPGYIMVQMLINDDTWYVLRNSTGVGGFTGPDGEPVPMSDAEVAAMLGTDKPEEEAGDEPAKVKIDFAVGETVKIKDGPFESFEGSIESVDELHGKVTVLVEIFGRPTPTELEYWQVEKI